MTLDHPERVLKLAVLDIIPTIEQYARADMQFGMRTWHWFFLPQAADFPEQWLRGESDEESSKDKPAKDEAADLAMRKPELIKSALDTKIVSHDAPLSGAKVVALFPPMTGG